MIDRSKQAIRCARDALEWAAGQLGGTSEPVISARLLLAHVLDCSTTDLFVHADRSLTVDQRNRFGDLVSQRAKHKPVAYLVGHREFLDLDLTIDERVLIPRPETELLVESVIEAAGKQPVRIADVGTGSGAIAVSLAVHLPEARIWATDISAAALEVAQENARRYGVLSRIAFVQGDLLAPLQELVDVIAANLPYVSRADYANLPPDIRLYEPRQALLSGDDGLDAIRALLDQAHDRLAPRGTLWIEIGADQGEAVLAAAARALPKAQSTVIQDYAHLDRLLYISFACRNGFSRKKS
ncbi:MAG: peptide chain release factor N(5)-glutamine methyltransferase [Anaerolineae bacterium]|nr:peptide chain release factor N(5)-glutamine methyltransferase [Anaerolineae bacterium]